MIQDGKRSHQKWMKFKTAKPGYFFRFRCKDDSSFILKQYPASVVPLSMFLNAVPAMPNKQYCALYNFALQRKTNVLTTFVWWIYIEHTQFYETSAHPPAWTLTGRQAIWGVITLIHIIMMENHHMMCNHHIMESHHMMESHHKF